MENVLHLNSEIVLNCEPKFELQPES
jgi:hypothetical protein